MSGGPPDDSEPPDGKSAALWADTLQSLANVVAHDLRNALNAVAVNLEVVRSRSARGAEASAIAPFAATAANNFETAPQRPRRSWPSCAPSRVGSSSPHS